MEEQEAQMLLKKYLNGDCTAEEEALLESWYVQASPSDSEISTSEILEDKQKIFAQLEMATRPRLRNTQWIKITTAAAAVAAIVFGIWLYMPSKTIVDPIVKTVKSIDIAPGGNKAVLTLANGEVIDLSSNQDGIVIQANQVSYNDGTAIETGLSNRPEEISKLNTISTPIGGQYQVVLPDGTKVWLNAASSLRYPSQFTSKERSVEITGEAYFDVTHDKKRPFRVSSKGQQIEVLGTHFNIMAYENEGLIKTTLLKGSVRVIAQTSKGKNTILLSPGQQSLLSAQNISVSNNVDLEEVTAWKNGYFKINEDIKSIMNKIARWYDIQVVYKPGVDLNQTFSGEVSKSRNVSALLKVMEMTGNVHFKIEERRIIVMP
jgi:transmembrane sensor